MPLILFFTVLFSFTLSFADVPMPQDTSHPGNDSMGYDFEIKDINEVRRGSKLYLPKRSDDVKVPLLVFGHGQALKEEHYDKTLEHLAKKGVATLFVQFDNGFFDQDWKRMAKDWNNITAKTLELYKDQINPEHIIYSGHSKGGYVGLMAAGAPNKTNVKATMLFAPAGYDAGYLANMDKDNVVTIFWGETDSIIKKADNLEIYNKLEVERKQFIELVSYNKLKADHYYPQNKSTFFGGKNGIHAFHYYGVWKWLVAAAWDLETKSGTTNPYIYGDKTLLTGEEGLSHKIQKNFEYRKQYLYEYVEGRKDNSFGNRNVTYVGHNIYKVNLSPAEVNEARASRSFKYIVPNIEFKELATPNDLHRNQWGFKNELGYDIKAINAWEMSTGAKDIVVGVVDSGINWRHPDLKNNLWVNKAEIEGEKGVDDDGNGYVDDVRGFNFTTNNPNSSDTRGHGTMVSGMIGATGNNGKGITGVAWNVQMMSLNMFPNLFGNATLESALKAIHYAIDNGAQIINASFGQADDDLTPDEGFKPLVAAIEKAKKEGILFVAAAGNSSGNNDVTGMIPATLEVDNILSVGAMNRKGNKWAKTNYGKKNVHVLAPGEEIYTTNGSGGMRYTSGTSLSAPIVSGIAVLMLDVNPDLTPLQMIVAMVNSCEKADPLKDLSQCGGYISAERAVKQAQVK